MIFYYFISQIENYSAYTTNKFLMDVYRKQLRYLEVSFPNKVFVGEIEEKTEERFLYKFNSIIENLNQFGPKFGRSRKLYSIRDESTDDILVINKMIYESFIKDFISTREINKIINYFYSHFGPNSYYLHGYLRDEYKEKLNSISNMIMTNYYPFIKNYKDMNEFELYEELELCEDAAIWEVYSEYRELKKYLDQLERSSWYMFGLRENGIL